jgi:hypothetical protein
MNFVIPASDNPLLAKEALASEPLPNEPLPNESGLNRR